MFPRSLCSRIPRNSSIFRQSSSFFSSEIEFGGQKIPASPRKISGRLVSSASKSGVGLKISGSQFSMLTLNQDSVLFHCSTASLASSASAQPKPESDTELVEVTFVKGDGERVTARGKVGDSLLDVVVDKDLPFDGFGACEGTLACSTCHVILKKPDFEKLPERPSDEELDMLDLAYGLADTSRLGCQIILSKDMKGLEVKVPEGVSDARSV